MTPDPIRCGGCKPVEQATLLTAKASTLDQTGKPLKAWRWGLPLRLGAGAAGSNHPCPNLKECLHIDDALAALPASVQDTSKAAAKVDG